MAEVYYRVGKIVNTQGLRGEVRVLSVTDFPDERFKAGSRLAIFDEKSHQEDVVVKSHRLHENFHLLKFEGMETIEAVEGFKGMTLMVSSQYREVNLSENEFFYDQIIGLPVYTLEGDLLGKVKSITSLGPNDVWTVQRHGEGKDILLPYIEQVVKQVDLQDQRIVIDLMEGLIDDED